VEIPVRSLNAGIVGFRGSTQPTGGTPTYLSSPLKSELSNYFLPEFAGDNTTITSNSILEQSSISNPKITYSIEQAGVLKNSTNNRAIVNVSSLQVSSSKVATICNRVPEIAIGQVGIGEVDITQVSPQQYSSGQINSGQIRFFSDTDINKIPLSSSISFKQFFHSNSNSGGYDSTSYQTTATLASGDSDRLCYFDRSEVVATAIDRS
jgi:hypothetical protein